ncbi:unnamed protein product [Closterium sp. Naga37s-1]|nr:unnamed protein product [Closterium sp. Naga37s-1]
MVSTASPSQHLRLALQHGADVSMSVRELDALLALLAEKRRKAEQEEAEMNMDILLDFLQRSRQKKQAELDEVGAHSSTCVQSAHPPSPLSLPPSAVPSPFQLRADLLFIREDIAAVEQRRSAQNMREQSAHPPSFLLFLPPFSPSAPRGPSVYPRGHSGGGAAQLRADLLFIREDIAAVEQRRRALQQMREQSAAAIHALLFRGGASSAGAGGGETGFGSGGLAGLKAGAGGGLAGSKRRGGPALAHHLQQSSQKSLRSGGHPTVESGRRRSAARSSSLAHFLVRRPAGVLPAPPPPGITQPPPSHSHSPVSHLLSSLPTPYSSNPRPQFDDLQECYLHHRRQAAHSGPSPQAHAHSHPPSLPPPLPLSQFDDLQECYLHHRRQAAHSAKPAGGASAAAEAGRRGNGLAAAAAEGGAVGQVDLGMGLEDFRQVLAAFTRFSRVKVVAELRQGDLFHSSNIVSSIEFDRDDEFFATAGVSRRIKVFNFSQVVGELADVHCPVVEMPTRSKLSCLSWNPYLKAHIASSDYEGIVTVWDVGTGQSLLEYEEHEKRAWSVDFARTEPTRLVSGSDDGKVKIWCTRQESSVLNIDMKANICCVKFNPGSANFIAVGSADHHIHYYDIRAPALPLHVFSGHRKAVSYVKFLSPSQLASASTDSTLRLWDVHSHAAIRTLRGHTNEKNFVGLSVNSDYIACGSETNEVYIYYKAMSKPMAVHRFTNSDPFNGEDSDEDTAHFISAVCWKGGGGEAGGAGAGGEGGGGQQQEATMLAANSQGTIKVLSLVP